MQPLVSIIIPTYNRSHLIGETLDSIIAQTYLSWECIVIDDGSNDYTDELLEFYCEKDSRIQFHHRPKDRPKGANACRNYGFGVSKGEFVHWFDSDDLMAQNNLKDKVDYLISHQECDFCISKVIKFAGAFGSGNFDYNKGSLKIHESLYEEYITGRISILNVTPLWRRRAFNLNELYDEIMFQFQDLDFYSRLIFNNNRIGILDKELIYVRRSNESISTKDLLFDLDVDSFLKVKERILQRTPFNSVIVNYIIRDILWGMRWYMARREYIYAKRCLNLALKYKDCLAFSLRIKLLKVATFFKLFKALQKGDTRFKSFLKI